MTKSERLARERVVRAAMEEHLLLKYAGFGRTDFRGRARQLWDACERLGAALARKEKK